VQSTKLDKLLIENYKKRNEKRENARKKWNANKESWPSHEGGREAGLEAGRLVGNTVREDVVQFPHPLHLRLLLLLLLLLLLHPRPPRATRPLLHGPGPGPGRGRFRRLEGQDRIEERDVAARVQTRARSSLPASAVNETWIEAHEALATRFPNVRA